MSTPCMAWHGRAHAEQEEQEVVKLQGCRLSCKLQVVYVHVLTCAHRVVLPQAVPVTTLSAATSRGLKHVQPGMAGHGRVWQGMGGYVSVWQGIC
jgi:hypothetical protein